VFHAKYVGTKTSAASTGAIKVGFAFAGTLGSISYKANGNVGTVNGAMANSQDQLFWNALAGGNATNTTASTPNWFLEIKA
jgi:allophanate hydrolase subunit 2